MHHLLGDRLEREAFHLPIARQHILACWRQAGAAAGRATACHRDQGLQEVFIHAAHQRPRRPIAHSHRISGLADGAQLRDALQQVSLARSDGHAMSDLKADVRLRGNTAFWHVRMQKAHP